VRAARALLWIPLQLGYGVRRPRHGCWGTSAYPGLVRLRRSAKPSVSPSRGDVAHRAVSLRTRAPRHYTGPVLLGRWRALIPSRGYRRRGIRFDGPFGDAGNTQVQAFTGGATLAAPARWTVSPFVLAGGGAISRKQLRRNGDGSLQLNLGVRPQQSGAVVWASQIRLPGGEFPCP
jgi:hypothetical protein